MVVFVLRPPDSRRAARSLHPAPFLSVAVGPGGVGRTGQSTQGRRGKEEPLPKTSLLEQPQRCLLASTAGSQAGWTLDSGTRAQAKSFLLVVIFSADSCWADALPKGIRDPASCFSQARRQRWVLVKISSGIKSPQLS